MKCNIKLKKLILLVIVLLLSCLNSYAQTNDNHPSTGQIKQSDTTVVAIPIKYIRSANAKLIERIYLKDIVGKQDTLIIMKDNYINEQKKIITDFQKRVDDANKINQAVKQDLNKQKIKNKIITYGAGATIIGLIIGLICK